GKILSKQGIHLHVYTIAKPGEFEEYERYAKNEKYFHFYTLMPYRDLIKEIARYDYALWVHPVYGKYGDEGATEEKLKVSIGNKLFTYLEAGLPIIISDHLDLGKKIVTNYKMGFSIKDSELNNLKEIIDGKEYPALKNNTLKAREYLSLDNQVKGLEEFYNLVLENQKLKD
ncbi:MAG: hypothetical protein Q7S74_05505, partial [Nanoarchaeota archaeon]|nr:hypothetical protein [Nanoarchaeota archaeon]